MLVAVGRWRWTKLRPPLGGGGWVVGSLYDAVAPVLIKVVLQNLWKGHEYFVVFTEVSEEVE